MIHAREDYNRIQDPMHKIPKDEPVFLIRAQDKVSAAAVRAWGELNEVADGSRELTDAAYDHAFLMEEWQENNGCKPADLPDVNEENTPVVIKNRIADCLSMGCKVGVIAEEMNLPIWVVQLVARERWEAKANEESEQKEWWEREDF